MSITTTCGSKFSTRRSSSAPSAAASTSKPSSLSPRTSMRRRSASSSASATFLCTPLRMPQDARVRLPGVQEPDEFFAALQGTCKADVPTMRAMSPAPPVRVALLLAFVLAIASGCGGSSDKKSSSNASGSSPAALAADAKSAATGDIPDNQNFLVYKGAAFSIKYPEGWSQQKSSAGIDFKDQNNIVPVAAAKGAAPKAARDNAELKENNTANTSLKALAPKQI